jgi:hypothetical protein
MINEPKASGQDDEVLSTPDATDEVDERPEPIVGDGSAGPGRTYTVAGLVQAHVPQQSLGRYIKAG